jgi:hypothetical protein
MKTSLLVVLQTHSKGNRDDNHVRYCNASKIEVSSRCTFSLIDSLNYAQEQYPDYEIELQIFDDHSDQEFLDILQKLIDTTKIKINLIHLETYGIMPSILRCYEHGKYHGKDWVYYVQDDFLHQQNSIELMIHAAEQFSSNLGKPASVFPFNKPAEYHDPENTAVACHLVVSKDRYWRTNIHPAFTLMTHISIIKKNWDLFYKMGTSKVSSTMEMDSICKIYYERGYYCFTPIPSLVLHMQTEWDKDFFIDWKSWWNEYSLDKLENYV